MRAIQFQRVTRAFRQLLNSHCVASGASQVPILHPTRSGLAVSFVRSGLFLEGGHARTTSSGHGLAIHTSSVSASSQGDDRFPGYVSKRKQAEKRKQQRKSKEKNLSAALPETLAASDIREQLSVPKEVSKSAPKSSQAADFSRSGTQEGRTSQDGQETSQNEKPEATQDPSAEEQKYAAEFQRIAGEPQWVPDQTWSRSIAMHALLWVTHDCKYATAARAVASKRQKIEGK